MASQTGVLFRVATFGESHGGAVGCVIDGCPPGISLPLEDIQDFLNRRRPGQSEFTTPRAEFDTAEILSGVLNGLTLGTPICISVRNKDQKSSDYADIAHTFRPSHADYTTSVKYGLRDAAGGGRSSARETIGRVAAAAVAKNVLLQTFPKLEVVSWVERIADIKASVNSDKVTASEVEKSLIRCPDPIAEELMKAKILSVKNAGDTAGGLICTAVRGVPAGLGEPVFDKLEADLAKAMLSLPATKSFEIGSGVAGTYLLGSQHNDPFVLSDTQQVVTQSNNSGGVQGGISNGMPILFSVGFKPVSTIFQAQKTVNSVGAEIDFTPTAGRHDSCVLPRAVPMVEAMTWLVLCDHYLRQVALSRGNFQKG